MMNLEPGTKVEHKLWGMIGEFTGEYHIPDGCSETYIQVKVPDFAGPAWWAVDEISILSLKRIRICDCGGAKTNQPHYSWCSTQEVL